MRASGFPSCCGYILLSDFGNTVYATHCHEYSLEEVGVFLKEKVEEQLQTNHAALIAVLNDQQIEKLGKAFKENGFKIIGRSYHPSHNTTIYMLKRNLKPLKLAKKFQFDIDIEE